MNFKQLITDVLFPNSDKVNDMYSLTEHPYDESLWAIRLNTKSKYNGVEFAFGKIALDTPDGFDPEFSDLSEASKIKINYNYKILQNPTGKNLEHDRKFETLITNILIDIVSSNEVEQETEDE